MIKLRETIVYPNDKLIEYLNYPRIKSLDDESSQVFARGGFRKSSAVSADGALYVTYGCGDR